MGRSKPLYELFFYHANECDRVCSKSHKGAWLRFAAIFPRGRYLDVLIRHYCYLLCLYVREFHARIVGRNSAYFLHLLRTYSVNNVLYECSN